MVAVIVLAIYVVIRLLWFGVQTISDLMDAILYGPRPRR
jgi:hypothetical protein